MQLTVIKTIILAAELKYLLCEYTRQIACIIGGNNGRTSVKSVPSSVWFKQLNIFLNEKIYYLKMLREGLQVHRDIKSLVKGRHDISEHGSDKINPFKYFSPNLILTRKIRFA